jgi:hypothetical protein
MRQPSSRGKTLLTCPVCQKQFWRYNAHIRNKTHCCSQRCSQTIKPRRSKVMLTATCLMCGKQFSRRKGVGNPMKYCSGSCLGKAVWAMRVARGEKHPCPIMSGPDNHMWKGGVAPRSTETRAVCRRKIREVGHCERCGSTEKLHAHHKEHHASAPGRRADPSNIEVLCTNCHAAEHPQTAAMLSFPRKRTGVTINCLLCGKARYVEPRLAQSAKYCSWACQKQRRRA